MPARGSSGARGPSNTNRRRRRAPSPPVNHLINQQNKMLDAKIAEMQELSRNLKVKLYKQKEQEVIGEDFKDLDKPIEEDELDNILQGVLEPPKETTAPLLPLTEKDKQLKLFDTPAKGIEISTPMLIKIGDSVQNIMNKDDLKWDVVINDLHVNKFGFKDLSEEDVVQFLRQIPPNTKLTSQSLIQLEDMLKDRPIGLQRESPILMNFYANNKQINKLEEKFNDLKRLNRHPALVYDIMIKGYVNAGDSKKVNEMLLEMQSLNLEPALKAYTNILQLCIKNNDVTQGESIFQMMKFRSLQTQPDLMAYNNMIQLQIKAKNVYKAIDYYEELLANGLEPNTYTLNALALVCSRDTTFILKGWTYIEEISKRNLEPNINTFEAMLRLAARDGDLELARALFMKIDELHSENLSNNNTTTNLDKIERSKNETLNYLMMAYRDFKTAHTPQSMLSKDISVIRRNTLRLVDFIGLHQNLTNDSAITKKRENLPPFLPLRTLMNQSQIIAEAKAIWGFNIIKTPSCLNIGNLITYLRVLVDQGASKEDFMQQFEQFTCLHKDIPISEKKDTITTTTEMLPANITGSTPLPPVLRIVKERFNGKLERETQLYRTLLSAGKRYKDLEMCEKAWVERGEYRKNCKYHLSLPRKAQQQLDFEFAKEMVLAMTECNELELAVKVVDSSKRLFPWNFYILKPLYHKLKDNGFTELCEDISFICNTAPKRI